MMRRNTNVVHAVKALITVKAFKITKMYILEKSLTNANIVLLVLLVKEIKECMKEVMKGIIVISKPILAIKVTLAKTEIIYPENVRAKVFINGFHFT
jgi:hypothetical protein